MTRNRNNIITFFVAFMLIAFSYRLLFMYQLSKNILFAPIIPFFYVPFGLISDLFLGIMLVLFLWLLQRFCKLPFLNIIILTLITICYLIHQKLFSLFFIGFNYNVLLNILRGAFTFKLALPYSNIFDCLFLLLPVIYYSFLNYIPFKYVLNFLIGIVSLVLIWTLVGLIIFFSGIPGTRYKNIIVLSPILYFAEDSWHNLNNQYTKRNDLPNKSQLHSVQFIDPLFVAPAQSPALISNKIAKKPYNVIIFVMESVGSNYIFKTSSSHGSPMPFLEKLSHQSLFLENNYSSGNNSPLAAFSILTGLYPNPSPIHYESTSTLHFPTIANWLGKSYHSLLFVSGSAEYFFPKGIISHSFNQFYSTQLQVFQFKHEALSSETDGFNQFLFHLHQLKAPYLSIYWSSAAHFPYHDYGFQYKIKTNSKNADYVRYMENLRLLDDEIGNLYQVLKKNGELENTILVVIGDHGEGFGQHPSSWLHGTSLYDEEIRTPVLFYQPAIFQPASIKTVTSSVDIVPTLLDTLGIKYNDHYFQGQSLLKNHFKQKYLFVYGDENELAGIDLMNKNKMIINFSEENCNIYNLQNDPKELNPLSCNNRQEIKSIIAFRNYQPKLLNWYNSKC